MPIYRVINEEIETMPTVDRTKYPEGGRAGTDEKYLGLDSGNAFESLGKSHPEYFDRERLKQLQSSENIVEDFNKYFNAFMDADVSKINHALESISIFDTKAQVEASKEAYAMNGTLVRMIQQDIQMVSIAGDLEIPDILKLITSTYLPESLSEDGCRKLIKIRLDNSRLLTDVLTKMLKLNYRAFKISQQEAQTMIDKMGSDKTAHEGIEMVKKMFQDPKKLSKFKKGNIYDFRSIGGGVLFFSSDDEMKLLEHPSKNLLNIFTYDAIVHAHGAYADIDTYNNKEEIPDGYMKIFDRINNSCKKLKELIKEIDEDINCNVLDDIIKRVSDKNKRPGFFTKAWVTTTAVKLTVLIKKAAIETSFLGDERTRLQKMEQEIATDINSLLYWRDSYIHPDKAIRDGDSSKWFIQPINTLSHRNMTKVIDVVRALKAEGFKNVLIGACNPGSVQLPKDIADDKSFKVRISPQSVILEYNIDDQINDLSMIKEQLDSLYEKTEYDNWTLERLLEEQNILIENVLNEGALDRLKEWAKKVWSFIVAIWRKVVDFFKNIYIRIKEFIANKFGANKTEKLSKSVEVNLIHMDGDNAKIEKVSCNSAEELEKEVSKANQSINDYIRRQSNIEIESIKTLNDKLNSGGLIKPKAEFFNFFKDLSFV